MQLRKLAVEGFRNLEPQTIEFSPTVTYVRGNNGQGKTNILEAVYLLAHGRSFRTHQSQNLIFWGNSEKAIAPRAEATAEGRVATEDGERVLRVTLTRKGREAFVNGNRAERLSDFYGKFRVLEFTPHDLDLVRGGPSIRRSFIDRFLAMTDPRFAETAVHYARALKQKNAVLKELRGKGPGSDNGAARLLEPWDAQLAAHGHLIQEKRALLVEHIKNLFVVSHQEIAATDELHPPETAEIFLKSDVGPQGALLTVDELKDRLARARPSDIAAGVTTVGPHRDDLACVLGVGSKRVDAREYASQGQARTFALALKLSLLTYMSSNREDPPVILLDDVEAELDDRRKYALYQRLKTLSCQAIITGTEEHGLFETCFPNAEIVTVSRGQIGRTTSKSDRGQ